MLDKMNSFEQAQNQIPQMWAEFWTNVKLSLSFSPILNLFLVTVLSFSEEETKKNRNS